MRQSFGKGIESLIPNKKEKLNEKTALKKEAVFSIEIGRIKSNPYQPRKEFDPEAIKALSESIREHGILQPLIVSKINNANIDSISAGSISAEYQLIAGERRLMAAKMIGLTQVPVIIRNPTDKEKLEVSLIENVQRLDLNPIEKAEAFKRLHDEFGLTHNQIGVMAGMARESVTNNIRLLELPGEVRDSLRAGKISEGHAKAILFVKTPEKQKALFEKILRDGLNVRESEYLGKKIGFWKPPVKKTISRQIFDELESLEMQIKEIFGVSSKTVKLKMERGRPILTVLFHSNNEVLNFIEKLNNKVKKD